MNVIFAETAANANVQTDAKKDVQTDAKKDVQTGTEQPKEEMPPEPPKPGMFENMFPVIMIVVIVVMFYLMYRGQKKEQKKRQEMIQGIKKDDKIRTIGGIHGVVTEVHDEYFKIKISSNTEIEVDKGAVNAVVTPGEADKK